MVQKDSSHVNILLFQAAVGNTQNFKLLLLPIFKYHGKKKKKDTRSLVMNGTNC